MATKISDSGTPIPVRLLKAHTHNDTPMKVGDTLDLWPDQVAWLAREGVVDPTPIVKE